MAHSIVSDEIAGPQVGASSGPWFVKVKDHDGFDALALVKTPSVNPHQLTEPHAAIELVKLLHPNNALYYSSTDSWVETYPPSGPRAQQDRWGDNEANGPVSPAVRATHIVPIGNICEHNVEIKQTFAVLRVEREEQMGGTGVVNRSGTLEVVLGAFCAD